MLFAEFSLRLHPIHLLQLPVYLYLIDTGVMNNRFRIQRARGLFGTLLFIREPRALDSRLLQIQQLRQIYDRLRTTVILRPRLPSLRSTCRQIFPRVIRTIEPQLT